MEQTWAVKPAVLALCVAYTYNSFLRVHKGWQGSESFSAIISNSRIQNNQVLHGISSTCSCRQPSMRDAKTSPAFILTRGVSCCLCSFVLFHVSMYWITPCQCKWFLASGQIIECVFLPAWRKLSSMSHIREFPKWEVEIRFFWLLGFHSRQSGDSLRQPEKFQLLCGSCITYLIHT